MPKQYPSVIIQSNWDSIMKGQINEGGWISSKIRNERSVYSSWKRSVNKTDKKVQFVLSDSSHFQYISHGNFSLVVKHISSGLKVAFICPTNPTLHETVHDKAILSIDATESALAVSSCEEDRLLVWDTRTDEVIQNLKGHGGPVYKCRFFPSGIVVLSAGADGSCRIWSAESGINPVTLKGHKMAVTDICIVDRGRNVISVSRDGTAKLWDVGKGSCLTNVVEGHGPINCCSITTTAEEVLVDNEREVGTNNKLLVVGCENGQVICAHVAMRQEMFCKKLESAVNACTVVEKSIIVGCENGKVLRLNIEDGSILDEWYDTANPVLSMAALHNQLFVVGRQDGTCTVLSLQEAHSATRVMLTGADADGIRDITFNGKWIFTACRDTIIRQYDFNQINVHYK